MLGIEKIKSRRPIVTVVLIFFCYIYFTSAWSGFRNPNEYSRFYLTRALVDEGGFAIDNLIAYRNTQDKSYFRGHFYTDKAPGSSFLAAPVYLAFRLLQVFFGYHPAETTVLYILRSAVISFPSALFLFFLFNLWGNITPEFSIRRGLLIAYALGTPAWPYSALFFGHQLAAISLFLSFYVIFDSRDRGGGARAAFGAGFFSGLAFFIEYPAVIISFFLFIYAIAVFKNVKSALSFLLGLAIPAGVVFYYHRQCFGGVLRFPYYFVTDPVCAAEHSRGMSGVFLPENMSEFANQLRALLNLLFSSFRGIFFYSPFLIFGIAGIFKMIRDPKWKKEGFLFAAIFISYLLFFCAFVNWEGGWALGPRHLTPLVPFLATAVVFQSAKTSASSRRPWIRLLTVLIIVSIVFTFVGLAVFPHLPAAFKNPLYEISWPFLAAGKFGPTIGEWMGLKGFSELIPIISALALLMIFLLGDLSFFAYRYGDRRYIFSATSVLLAAALLYLGLILSGLKGKEETSSRIEKRELVESFLRR